MRLSETICQIFRGGRSISGQEMRRAAIVLTAVLFGLFVLLEGLNFSGFCYSKQRYLSDAELIGVAVANNLARHSPQLDSSRRKMYSSLSDFFQQNPNCCKLSRWTTSPISSSLSLRLFGVYEALVDIVYRINDGGGVDNFYASMTIVDSCGKVIEVRGEPLAKNPKDRS